MNTNASNTRIHQLIIAIEEGKLLPRPEFQRRLVWKNEDKIRLLETVLAGLPFPEIYTAAGEIDLETGASKTLLVDGQQRVTTLHQYMKDVGEIDYGSFSKYSSLDDAQKRSFLDYTVVVRDLGSISNDQIREVFRRINSTSYGLNSFEIHNAVYNGEFKKLGEQIAEEGFFIDHKIFNTTDIKRMRDTQYILTLVATVMSTYFSGENGLEEFLSNYNEKFEQKNVIYFNIKTLLVSIDDFGLPVKSRAWNKAGFFTLFVELYRYLFDEGASVDIYLKNRLANFYSTVDEYTSANINDAPEDIKNYYIAVLQGSNDRLRRNTRGAVLRKILKGDTV